LAHAILAKVIKYSLRTLFRSRVLQVADMVALTAETKAGTNASNVSSTDGPCTASDAMQIAQSFNIERVVANILADTKFSSLALPELMTAAQRKHAKAIVEQHPELKCESFGLGKDRRMHVFKCTLGAHSSRGDLISDCSSHSVNVKNTFIDDWVHADSKRADNRIVQSMPHNMFAKCLAAEQPEAASATGGLRLPAVGNVNDVADSSPIVAKETSSRWVEELVVEEQLFDVGTQVVINGLVKAPSFNGAIGVVQSWDAGTGRYNLLLAQATCTGQRWAKLKAENLQLFSR